MLLCCCADNKSWTQDRGEVLMEIWRQTGRWLRVLGSNKAMRTIVHKRTLSAFPETGLVR